MMYSRAPGRGSGGAVERISPAGRGDVLSAPDASQGAASNRLRFGQPVTPSRKRANVLCASHRLASEPPSRKRADEKAQPKLYYCVAGA